MIQFDDTISPIQIDFYYLGRRVLKTYSHFIPTTNDAIDIETEAGNERFEVISRKIYFSKENKISKIFIFLQR